MVLAKYFEMESNPRVYSWYRAIVTNFDASLEKYTVMYFDYGNFYDNLTDGDLVSLPIKYDTAENAPFAFKVTLNDAKINADTDHNILCDFFGDEMLIKVVEVRSETLPGPGLKMYNHLVEIYDVQKKSCLNALVNKNYKPVNVAATSSLPSKNSLTSLASKLKEVNIAQVEPINETQEQPRDQIKDLNLNKLKTGEQYECKIALLGKIANCLFFISNL